MPRILDTCKILTKGIFRSRLRGAGGTEGAATYPELGEAKTTEDPRGVWTAELSLEGAGEAGRETRARETPMRPHARGLGNVAAELGL